MGVRTAPHTRGGPTDTRFGDCAPRAAAKLEAGEDEREGAKVFNKASALREHPEKEQIFLPEHTFARAFKGSKLVMIIVAFFHSSA